MLSAKENALKLFHHEIPDYIPKYGEGIINNVPVGGFYERPAGGKGGLDWFGVEWVFEEGDPAPMPSQNYILEDICEWEDVIRFPDLDAFDWEAAAKTDRIPEFDRENHLLSQIIHQGCLERLNSTMGMEEGLCALITDPDECKDFFEAVADHKCRLLDKLHEYYKPDIVCYHDDWGSQKSLLIPPETWREQLLPATKRIAQHAKELGIFFELHSDGMIKDIVPEIVEEIQPDAIQLMRINNIPELKKMTGRKVVYDVFVDIQSIDAQENAGTLTEEILRDQINKEFTEQAFGGAYLPNLYMIHPKWRDVVFDEFEKMRMKIYQG